MLSAESIKMLMFLADFEGRISKFPTATDHPETFARSFCVLKITTSVLGHLALGNQLPSNSKLLLYKIQVFPAQLHFFRFK